MSLAGESRRDAVVHERPERLDEPVVGLASRLRWSDPRDHFFRAFRRWYGMPPGQFRAQIASEQ